MHQYADADILIFRMSGAESASNAARLAETVRSAGFAPHTIPYWSDDAAAHDDDPLLTGQGFDDAPLMTRYRLKRRLDLDLDLLDLSAHSFALRNVNPDIALLESVWSRRMRGVAHLASERIARSRPAAVLVPHGAELVSRMLASVAAHHKVPYLYWESPFFPDHHFVDPYAPHFFRGACRLDQTWPPAPCGAQHDALIARGRRHINAWRRKPFSKYRQATDPAELAALDAWLAAGDGPVVFIPGQFQDDGAVVVNLGNYPDLSATYRAALASLPAGWRIIFKRHPLYPDGIALEGPAGRLFAAGQIALADLFARSQAVALHSSTVGLEALIAGLPLLNWGRPVYSGKGVTIDLDDAAELGFRLAQGAPRPASSDDVARLIGHILENGLIEHGDGAKLRRFIREAGCSAPEPRLKCYGPPVQALAEAASALDAALAETPVLARAVGRLPARQAGLLYHHLGLPRDGASGEEVALPRALLDLHAGFAEATGLVVAESAVDLQACADPQAALRNLAAEIKPGRPLTLQVGRPQQDTLQPLDRRDLDDLTAGLEGIRSRIFVLRARRLSVESDAAYEAYAERVILLSSATEASSSRDLAVELANQRFRYAPLHLDHTLFSYPTGPASTAKFRTIEPGPGGHIAYGPHVALPAGRWRATFLLQLRWRQIWRLSGGRPKSTRLVCDVYNPVHGIVASAECRYPEEAPPAIAFASDAEGQFEFRIFRPSDGSAVIFAGVDLVDNSC